jgi:hypothetical protein
VITDWWITFRSWSVRPDELIHCHLANLDFEAIGIFQPPDVRPIIKAYEGKNIPIEYAKREAERKQAAIEEWEQEHGGALVGAGAGTSWLGKIFGGLGGVRPLNLYFLSR